MKKVTLASLREEKASLNAQIDIIDAQIEVLLAKTLVLCEDNNYGKGCERGFRIKDLEYIQTHWYESPWGCTGGDHWHAGEGQWLCPKCGHRNRLYKYPDVEALSHLFESRVDDFSKGR